MKVKKCKLCGYEMSIYSPCHIKEGWQKKRLYDMGYCSNKCRKTDKMISNIDVMEK